MPRSTLERRSTVAGELALQPLSSVSVYVHIPFCGSRCRYCDFHFETTRSRQIMQSVLEGILIEAESSMRLLGGPRIRSVYFGGGTPSLLPPDLLANFLPRFRRILRIDPADAMEWSFEANPETTGDELLSVLASHGVNRLSIGVQSFHNRLLHELGRRADRSTALLALKRAADHSAAIPHLNIDLMTGVPGQSARDVREDVRTALDFPVDHISLYSLTVESRTPLAQAVGTRAQLLPEESMQERLWIAAARKIERSGFDWYEVSNFAREAGRSLHNLGYWALEPYLGLGPGAVSTLPAAGSHAAGRRNGPVRWRNPGLFLYRPRSPETVVNDLRRDVEVIAPTDFLLEHFITGLRTPSGVRLQRIRNIFGEAADGLLPLIERWEERGLLTENWVSKREEIALVPDERLRLDRHLVELARQVDQLALAGPVAWPWPG
ncbi:radical SAM family heme chaperone HemW [Salinispira pacifica]